jgi:hypothetical protein
LRRNAIRSGVCVSALVTLDMMGTDEPIVCGAEFSAARVCALVTGRAI